MGTTPNGIWYPESGDSTRIWELMRQQAETIDKIVSVANVTERTALAAAFAPTPARPLYVHRRDARHRLEWTEDGENWTPVPGKNPIRLMRRVSGNNVASGSNWMMGVGWQFQTGDGGNESGMTYEAGVVTLTQAGMYRIHLRHIVPVLSSGTWTIGVALNGGNPLTGRQLYDQEARGTRLCYDAVEPFNAGDTLQGFIRQVSGSTVTVSPADMSRWEIERVGPL